jgi:hypothetical protein
MRTYSAPVTIAAGQPPAWTLALPAPTPTLSGAVFASWRWLATKRGQR